MTKITHGASADNFSSLHRPLLGSVATHRTIIHLTAKGHDVSRKPPTLNLKLHSVPRWSTTPSAKG